MEDEQQPDPTVTAKPPDIISKLEWLRRYGWRHRGLVLLAIFISAGTWMASMTSGLAFLKSTADLLVNRKIRQTINDLRDQYRLAFKGLSDSGTGDFTKAGRDIDDILKLDPANGHGLYYSGEVQRISDPQSLFTPISCVKPEKLANGNGNLDVYEKSFLRYIDIENTVQDKESKEDFASETCYKHASGYCAQRTAWINHLLANDFYEQAKLLNDRETERDKLQRALRYANAAIKYRDEKGTPGFFQCMPTTVLIGKIREAIAALDTTHQ